MRSLVLCQGCKCHVKVSETLCPFCGAAVVLPRERATRPRGLPGGRAALFLAGTALVPGCADEPEPDVLNEHEGGAGAADGGVTHDAGTDANVGIVPVYGVPVPVYGAPIDPQRDSGFVVPPYGIAIPDPPVDAGAKDSGASCPQIGRLPAPVYGIAVDAGTRTDVCTDAGQDAGRDAGHDAGKDSGLIGVPVYGIAIDVTHERKAQERG